MKLVKECWLALLDAFNALTGTPTDGNQQSLGFLGWPGRGHVPHIPNHSVSTEANDPLVFRPPSLGEERNDTIWCDYRAMGAGWKPCSTENDRGCWLKGPAGTRRFDIDTDYENQAPKGITRKYVLDVTKKTIHADGLPMPWGKVFNDQYPGPWIQACWGDEVEITVRNHLEHNGTAIHWHGIRMLNTTENDGVNAVSQCPIAPGDEFTYKFKTWQYGTSWYHSHYSLQYGDGMLGPLTIHGPATAPFDHPIDPILMSDWNHRSAFMDFQNELEGIVPTMDSIILNGKGSYAAIGNGGNKYKAKFEYGKKYLLRLINTSVDTTFVFAIDNHNVTVIASDFVPIHPYNTDHVVVGIGQRYHVIVEAKPHEYGTNKPIIDLQKAFWIRTIPADHCSNFPNGGKPDERQGILSYNNTEAIPTTVRAELNTTCRDEPYEKLRPWLYWDIDVPDANETKAMVRDSFEIGTEVPKPPDGRPFPCDRFARWSMGKDPMYLNFSDPTILNLGASLSSFPNRKVVVNYPQDSWVYMVITGMYSNRSLSRDVDRTYIPAAHPMHLHGHDFALLQQSEKEFNETNFHPKFDNPPRRDVVLLPARGFIAIAFKADNPGAWAFHCHIAWHASSGLAIQVLERASDALALLSANQTRLGEIVNTCTKWNQWFSNPNNFWHPELGELGFQDDSGV